MTSAHTAYVFASYAFVAPIPPAYSLDSADSDAGGLTWMESARSRYGTTRKFMHKLLCRLGPLN